LSERKRCGNSLGPFARLSGRQNTVIRAKGVNLVEFSRNSIFDHLGKAAKTAVRFPIVSKINNVAGPLGECVEPAMVNALHKSLGIGHTKGPRQRTTLIF